MKVYATDIKKEYSDLTNNQHLSKRQAIIRLVMKYKVRFVDVIEIIDEIDMLKFETKIFNWDLRREQTDELR